MNFATGLFRRFWLSTAVLLLAVLIMVYHNGVSAAPEQQTVPPPTFTSAATVVPTATSVPDNNNDDDDDPSPTATPTPIPPTATPEGPTAVVSVVRLNVREGPSIDFPVVGVVTNGRTLRVLGRNEAGDWWQICCVPRTNTVGWVSAQFVQPNFDRNQAQDLVPLIGDLPVPPPPTATPDPLQAPTPDPNAGVATAPFQFQMQQDPAYTWQGQEVDLLYEVVNLTDTVLSNLELRNELPNQLTFVDFVEIGGGDAMTETTEFDTTAFTITWPELEAGATETMRVRVRVADELPDGSVISNLAVVVADEESAVTAGISIGMPPTTLPDFR
ncbi:MAG: SH3 domain-containing protein [Caldilineaceae bacterium]|nr:SH3 domain-containing protein [Caldilineaceae bacterium]